MQIEVLQATSTKMEGRWEALEDLVYPTWEVEERQEFKKTHLWEIDLG
jgi:hypothetical protein